MSGFVFQAPGFRFQVSGFGLRVAGFGFHVSVLGFEGLGSGFGTQDDRAAFEAKEYFVAFVGREDRRQKRVGWDLD